MELTAEQKVELLLELPWSVVSDCTQEGDHLLRVSEIPSAVGTGETAEAIAADLKESLRASLAAYLHFGDPIPLPNGVSLPWAPAIPA